MQFQGNAQQGQFQGNAQQDNVHPLIAQFMNNAQQGNAQLPPVQQAQEESDLDLAYVAEPPNGRGYAAYLITWSFPRVTGGAAEDWKKEIKEPDVVQQIEKNGPGEVQQIGRKEPEGVQQIERKEPEEAQQIERKEPEGVQQIERKEAEEAQQIERKGPDGVDAAGEKRKFPAEDEQAAKRSRNVDESDEFDRPVSAPKAKKRPVGRPKKEAKQKAAAKKAAKAEAAHKRKNPDEETRKGFLDIILEAFAGEKYPVRGRRTRFLR